mgnify:CR=1 FL=1
MLREVLAFLDGGDRADAVAFIERWSQWTDVNEEIARRVRGVERYRFNRYVYPALRAGAGAEAGAGAWRPNPPGT